jgi:hypothetical protein
LISLVKFGVPIEVANNLSRTARLAWLVICGELDGGEFNWSRGEWVKQ